MARVTLLGVALAALLSALGLAAGSAHSALRMARTAFRSLKPSAARAAQTSASFACGALTEAGNVSWLVVREVDAL
jgi:hypothetical protein